MPVAGLDLSPPMMAKLVEKAGGAPPFPLVLGDATRMPFADDAFGGAYLRWVLHLIPDWRAALAEMVRVVRPGGVLLVSPRGVRRGGHGDPSREFSEITGCRDRSRRPDVGRARGARRRASNRLGARLRLLPPIPEEDEETARVEFLDAIEEGRWSWTWHVPEDARRDAVRELRPWAEERFGPLDRVDRYRARDRLACLRPARRRLNPDP